jgi:alpha-L-fucosidase
MTVKERPWQALYAPGMTTLDYERGKASHILPDPWQTDDSIGPWGYRSGTWMDTHGNKLEVKYMDTNMVIDKFLDIVSKNGNLLLNVPIRADGTLDEKTTEVLEGMGEWMAVNSEGIFGSRPFYMFGEGKVNEIDHRATRSPYTSKDIRKVTLQNITVMNKRIKPVASVSMLGVEEPIEWEQSPDGLVIVMPDEKPGEHAFGIKIGFAE